MRRDLIIGIIASALLHGGVIGTSFIKSPPKPPPPVVEPPTIELMEMPPLDIEPEEIIETDGPASEPLEFAPPMQTDVPQLVTVDSFVQRIQPPPPENLKPNVGVITIPTARQVGLGKGIAIFDINNLDQIPVAKFRAQPQYPFEMTRASISGRVMVGFIVNTRGEVKNAYAVSSTQHEFEKAAVQAVSKWKFRPGRKGGRAVNSRMQVPIVFRIDN